LVTPFAGSLTDFAEQLFGLGEFVVSGSVRRPRIGLQVIDEFREPSISRVVRNDGRVLDDVSADSRLLPQRVKVPWRRDRVLVAGTQAIVDGDEIDRSSVVGQCLNRSPCFLMSVDAEVVSPNDGSQLVEL
jgi:hypothetical protein